MGKRHPYGERVSDIRQIEDGDIQPVEEFTSVDGVFRAALKKMSPSLQVGFRNIVRIMEDPMTEASEKIAAFNALAKYTLYQPEKRVEHNVSHQHRLTLGSEALAAMGFEKTRTVITKPDGSTEVLEEVSLGPEIADAEVIDGDG